jgi:hypothetical protein
MGLIIRSMILKVRSRFRNLLFLKTSLKSLKVQMLIISSIVVSIVLPKAKITVSIIVIMRVRLYFKKLTI